MNNKTRFDIVMSSLIVVMVMAIIALALITLTGCTHVKKAVVKEDLKVEQGSTQTIVERTNTIYTDTGSITTYYRDSLIKLTDTIIQLKEKEVIRWFKQQIKHDSIYVNTHDTLTVERIVTQTTKEKTALPWWFWVAVFGGIGFGIFTLIKKV